MELEFTGIRLGLWGKGLGGYGVRVWVIFGVLWGYCWMAVCISKL